MLNLQCRPAGDPAPVIKRRQVPQLKRQTGSVGIDLEAHLGLSSIIFGLLNERLQVLIKPTLDGYSAISAESKVAAVWNESEIYQLLNLVRGQV